MPTGNISEYYCRVERGVISKLEKQENVPRDRGGKEDQVSEWPRVAAGKL